MAAVAFLKAMQPALPYWYSCSMYKMLLPRCICVWITQQSANGFYAPTQLVIAARKT